MTRMGSWVCEICSTMVYGIQYSWTRYTTSITRRVEGTGRVPLDVVYGIQTMTMNTVQT